jgi:hypothetical protein
MALPSELAWVQELVLALVQESALASVQELGQLPGTDTPRRADRRQCSSRPIGYCLI